MYIIDMVPREKRVSKGWEWRIVALATTGEGDGCETYEYIAGRSESERDGLITLFELACEKGPNAMPRDNRHELDSVNGIFEFIKGRNRIAWFYDEGKVVVCCGGFFKDTQKTPAKVKKAALKAKKAYFEAKQNGQLIDPR